MPAEAATAEVLTAGTAPAGTAPAGTAPAGTLAGRAGVVAGTVPAPTAMVLVVVVTVLPAVMVPAAAVLAAVARAAMGQWPGSVPVAVVSAVMAVAGASPISTISPARVLAAPYATSRLGRGSGVARAEVARRAGTACSGKARGEMRPSGIAAMASAVTVLCLLPSLVLSGELAGPRRAPRQRGGARAAIAAALNVTALNVTGTSSGRQAGMIAAAGTRVRIAGALAPATMTTGTMTAPMTCCRLAVSPGAPVRGSMIRKNGPYAPEAEAARTGHRHRAGTAPPPDVRTGTAAAAPARTPVLTAARALRAQAGARTPCLRSSRGRAGASATTTANGRVPSGTSFPTSTTGPSLPLTSR
jgi:hypothetical protein